MQNIFQNVDSIERELFTISAEAKLKCRVSLSSKSGKGGRLAADYSKSYPSTRFNDRDENTSLHLRTSDYIVLAFGAKIDDVYVSEEVFISYPNMQALFDGFKSFDKKVKEYYEELFYLDDQNELHVQDEYVEYCSELIEGLASDKVIQLMPAVHYDNDNNALPGVAIFFNMEDYYTIITMERYVNLKRILQEINLVQLSQELINFAAMEVIFNNLGFGGGGSPAPQSGTTLSKKPTPLGKRTGTLEKRGLAPKPPVKSDKPSVKPKNKAEIDGVFKDNKKKPKPNLEVLDEEDEEKVPVKDDYSVHDDGEGVPFDMDEETTEDEEEYDDTKQPEFLTNVLAQAENISAETLFDD